MVFDESLRRNCQALSDVIGDLNTPKSRVVVGTHERLSKTNVDFEGLPIFLFGHRHVFTETKFKGTQYVNVSALDRRRLIRPKTFLPGDHFKQFRNLNGGKYVIMQWSEGTGFSVKSVDLELDHNLQENWEIETDFQMPSAPFLF